MYFSAVDFNPYQGTDKRPSNEIKSGQSLQSFLADSGIASSSRGDFDKVSIVPLPPPWQRGRSQHSEAHQLNLLKSDVVTISISPCPNCGSTQARQTAGKGPHHAGLRCANCDQFLKWLPSPKPELSSDEGGQQ